MSARVWLCMLVVVVVSLTARGQERYSFSFRNVGMDRILTEIGTETGYKFLYNSRNIPSNPLNFTVHKTTLPRILSRLLGDSLQFNILDNKLIVISAIGAPASRTITGVLTNGRDQPVSGATIHIEDETAGTVSDSSGYFTLEIKRESVLRVSHIGYYEKNVNTAGLSHIKLELAEKHKDLEEITVTALEIPKETRSIGYATQSFKVAGTDIVKSREPNAFTSLYGKVAGLGVQNSRYLFNNPSLYLRGQRPLVVVDGIPVDTDSWDINMDDVESITVLKGPAAGALYGQQGANGAVQIKTRRGATNKRPVEVSFSSTTEWQVSPVAFPHSQGSYGPGDYFKYAYKDGKGGGINDFDYNIWGPRMEGQLITQWDSPLDANGNLVPLPWLPRNKNNLRDFLDNGMLTISNLALSAKSDQGDFRISMTRHFQRGIVPNSKLGITTVNMSLGQNIGKRLRADVMVNYNRQNTPNYPSIYYGPESPVYELLIWNGANFDINDPRLRNYWKPGQEGVQQQWLEYVRYNNPWFNAYENTKAFSKDVFTGFVSLGYKISPAFNLQLKSDFNIHYTGQEWHFPVSGNFYGLDFYKVGAYMEASSRFSQQNASFMLNFQRKIENNWSVKLSAGGNLQTIRRKNYSAHTSGGLTVPGVYNLQNSAMPVNNAENYRSLMQVASFYGYADVAYKNLLYLDVSGRFDRNSNMPLHNNLYFYPQASISAIISDMVKLPRAISFLKWTGSLARVGEGLSPYSLAQTYEWATAWLGNQGVTYAPDNVLYNPNIKPEFHTTMETGLDARFFNQRAGLKAQVYRTVDGPQIFNLSISAASGWGYQKMNGLELERRGVELIADAIPVQRKHFTWTMAGNVSRNIRYLKKVYDSLDHHIRVNVGERFDQLYVNPFERNPHTGAILFHPNGTPVINRQRFVRFGNTDPDWLVGMQQQFKYKSFQLTLDFDGSFGGKFSNYLNLKMWQAGSHPDSDNYFRYQDWLHYKDPGYRGTRVGVGDVVTGGTVTYDADGKILTDTRTFAPNTTPVLEQDWATTYETADERRYQSKTYFKMRGVTLTYTLPAAMLRKIKGLHGGSVSLVGRNIMYLSKQKQIDLDRWSYTSGSDLEEPSMRSIGFNVHLNF
ncbi:SusC/RagA family TonB-linked outer membrane protein [Chitinophaga caseinilytica]|uniref:SusC/RagA family TonB-linked outer membrane protein n=1 Tax=Chitinophaga caseinilytica TaxID=2267521 RepID=UPI003C2D51E3